jgi:hypothetical protein
MCSYSYSNRCGFLQDECFEDKIKILYLKYCTVYLKQMYWELFFICFIILGFNRNSTMRYFSTTIQKDCYVTEARLTIKHTHVLLVFYN